MQLARPLLLILAFTYLLGGNRSDGANPKHAITKMKITVGSSSFTATLEDNQTAAAFKATLPMTIKMTELNGNEKYYQLPSELPAKAASPGKIENGDLMLYGDDTLVLFYKLFATTYSYTRLGRIDDPAGLAAAVGSGTVTVTYELK